MKLTSIKLNKDFWSVLLLTGLYLLQGIPLGLSSVIPTFFQSNANTLDYNLQATYSWTSWPFSIKLLWAPIVDAVYSRRFGRRKSWLIPVQTLLGLNLILLGSYIDSWLARPKGDPWGPLGSTGEVGIYAITATFFVLEFFAATQDIAVDGWALTLLSKKNLGWQATCQSVGQSLGTLLGYNLLIALESPSVANTYFRSNPIPGQGLVSYSTYLFIWGGVFIVATALIGIFIREKNNREADDLEGEEVGSADFEVKVTDDSSAIDELVFGVPETPTLTSTPPQDELEIAKPSAGGAGAEPPNLCKTFLSMLNIVRLKAIIKYFFFLFIYNISLMGDRIAGLKLLEKGVPRENLAFISSCLIPLNLLLPFLVTRWSTGPRPLRTLLIVAIPCFLVTIGHVLLVYFIDYFKLPPTTAVNASTLDVNATEVEVKSEYSVGFYVIIAVVQVVFTVLGNVSYLCQMAFHARISDPAIGGTYMTILNTFSNLASLIPSTILLYLVESLTWRYCDSISLSSVIAYAKQWFPTKSPEEIDAFAKEYLASNATCVVPHGKRACEAVGGTCGIVFDAMYIQLIFCSSIGVLVFYFLYRIARQLDTNPMGAYRYNSESVVRLPFSLKCRGMWRKKKRVEDSSAVDREDAQC